MYKTINKFDYSNYVGDLFPLKEFLSCVKCGGFIPDDGCIGDIVIDGDKTNIIVRGWGMWLRSGTKMELEQLKKIKGKVEVIWCNR